jgi:hypothetical protein
MTREAFIEKYLDEVVGLLLASFARSEMTRHKMATDAWADDGKFMLQQMRRARGLLGRLYDDLKKTEAPTSQNPRR